MEGRRYCHAVRKKEPAALRPILSMVQSLVERLSHGFDLAWPPCLGEERFKRAVEPQGRDKAFTGHGLYPVAPFDTRWLCRAEVDRRGAVSVCFSGGGRE